MGKRRYGGESKGVEEREEVWGRGFGLLHCVIVGTRIVQPSAALAFAF